MQGTLWHISVHGDNMYKNQEVSSMSAGRMKAGGHPSKGIDSQGFQGHGIPPALHAGGQGFKSPRLHQTRHLSKRTTRSLIGALGTRNVVATSSTSNSSCRNAMISGDGVLRWLLVLCCPFLIHERPVEPRSLPVRLPCHEQVPSAGGSISDCEHLTGTQNDKLCRHCPAPIDTESGLALQHIGEALELGWYRCGDLPTPREFDVEDERRRPQASRRALAHQYTDRRVALVSQGDLLRFQDLHARLDLLILPGQVDPEQHDAELGPGQALPDLVRSQSVGMPYPSPGPEHQEFSLAQPRPLHCSGRAGTVTGAERTLEHG